MASGVMLLARSQVRSYSGWTKIGIAPDKIKPEITEEWIFRGKIILSPGPQVATMAAIIPQVEPFAKNRVESAPNAWAANS